MAIPTGVALWSLAVLWTAWVSVKWWKNIQAAKKSGLPYIIAPWSPIGVQWNLLSEIVAPILNRIPFLPEGVYIWVNIIDRQGSYHNPRYVDEKLGDTVIMATPWIVYLKTSNAELASQLTTRKLDFLKPTWEYKIVDLFGRSIISQEGGEWKRHRRIVGPSFSERANKYVFEESLRQTQSMMEMWIAEQELGVIDELRVKDTAPFVATISLHVICAVGFGAPQIWPNESEEKLEGRGVPGFSALSRVRGHKMSFKEGLHTVVKNIMWFVLLPRWLFNILPFETLRDGKKAWEETMQYFQDLVEYKREQLNLGNDDKETRDLLGPMIKATYGVDDPESKTESIPQDQRLSKSELIGNSFIFLFAGQETASNNIHFSILELCMAPASQRRLQADVDSIVGNKPIAGWDYHKDMPRLYNSLVGATLAEELRLIPPIINIPKTTNGDQTVTIDGERYTIPNETFCHLTTVAVHRNPRYWPEEPNEFLPERWLKTTVDEKITPEDDDSQNEDIVSFETSSFDRSGSSTLFKPAKGTYVAFSEGQRACPGRRFAQVQGIAVIAALFQKYSCELDVSDWATDEEVARMSREKKIELYEKARARCNAVIGRSMQLITIQMLPGDHVPVSFVKRGNERFLGLYQ